MGTIIDINQWRRREYYKMFKDIDYPYAGITTPLCVSKAIQYSKDNGISLYALMCYLSQKAAGKIPEFLTRIQKDTVVQYDSLFQISATLINESNNYCFIYAECTNDLADFIENFHRGKDKACGSDTLIPLTTDNCIFITCTPWYRTTSIVNPLNSAAKDCIPRLSWGKIFEHNEEKYVDYSILVHHALADGYHIHLFLTQIEQLINDLYK